jgi:hypothetical protein
MIASVNLMGNIVEVFPYAIEIEFIIGTLLDMPQGLKLEG